MSTMIPPSQTEQAPDELDGLLRAYFQSEMPKPWPAFQAPMTSSAPVGGWWAKSRSRVALAASIAMLLLASWFLAGRHAEYVTPLKGISTGTGDAKAGAPAILKKVDEKPALPANR